LGGGIAYSDLAFERSGNDLLLDTGRSDIITFKDWYADTANQTFVTLQMIAAASADYAPASGDVLRDQKMEFFDFHQLVADFDASGLNRWNVMDSLLNAHLGGADDAAFGGEFSFSYGMTGSLAQAGISNVQEALKAPEFGGLQALKPLQGLPGEATIGR
jgi:hypothetical protein